MAAVRAVPQAILDPQAGIFSNSRLLLPGCRAQSWRDRTQTTPQYRASPVQRPAKKSVVFAQERTAPLHPLSCFSHVRNFVFGSFGRTMGTADHARHYA
jgi:hypothetical protein